MFAGCLRGWLFNSVDMFGFCVVMIVSLWRLCVFVTIMALVLVFIAVCGLCMMFLDC